MQIYMFSEEAGCNTSVVQYRYGNCKTAVSPHLLERFCMLNYRDRELNIVVGLGLCLSASCPGAVKIVITQQRGFGTPSLGDKV